MKPSIKQLEIKIKKYDFEWAKFSANLPEPKGGSYLEQLQAFEFQLRFDKYLIRQSENKDYNNEDGLSDLLKTEEAIGRVRMALMMVKDTKTLVEYSSLPYDDFTAYLLNYIKPYFLED